MKTWIQFHHKSAIGDELIPACGDRAVIILDGRVRSDTHHAIAKEEALLRGYPAYQLHRGPKLFHSLSSHADPLIKVFPYQPLDWRTTYVDEVEALKVEFLKHAKAEEQAHEEGNGNAAYFARKKALKVQRILEKEHGLWIL